MKKFSLLALAAAGLLLGACSSDKDVAVDEKAWNGDGDGYMALTINLPTNPTATRAANDVYDDGIAAEYNVQDAALLLFTGASESAATLMSAQPLTLPFPETDDDVDNDNITTSYQAVAKVSGSISGKLYALVVLNYKNVFTIGSGTATIAGTSTAVTTLESIQSAAANIVEGNGKFTNKGSNATSNYFFMTNALLQNLETGNPGTDHTADEPTKGTSAPLATNIQTLALVDASKIYRTEAEAKANPAADIYVERAVAKATLTYDNTTAATIQGNTGTQTALNVSSVEWAIDNIEPASFIVRNPGDNAYIAYSSEAFGTDYVYRFVGDKAMGKTATLHNYYTPVYRHYWAIDPVYDVPNASRTSAQTLLPAPKYVSTSTPLYCNENTFNVANQKYESTTRAVIKVTTDGGTFYTVNGGQTRYSENDAKSYLVTDIVENADFQNKIKSCLKPDKSYTFSASSINPTYAENAATAQVTISSITLPNSEYTSENFYMTTSDIPSDAPAGTKAISQLTFSDEIAAANGNWKVLKYTDGIVYYEARFEHFANTYYEKTTASPTATGAFNAGDLAPWNFWETTKPSGTNAYPANSKTAEENYLGRWGMVRNNWYDVTISEFKKLGMPVDPSGNVDNPSTPDDNVEDYISVKIHVLSWAKRTQRWIL